MHSKESLVQLRQQMVEQGIPSTGGTALKVRENLRTIAPGVENIHLEYGVDGVGPVRQEMTRVRPLTGAAGGLVETDQPGLTDPEQAARFVAATGPTTLTSVRIQSFSPTIA